MISISFNHLVAIVCIIFFIVVLSAVAFRKDKTQAKIRKVEGLFANGKTPRGRKRRKKKA